MEELNFKEEELKGFKEFNKGGYEGKFFYTNQKFY